MMHAIALIIASTPAPADPPRRPDGTDPWAIGFAVTVARSCPGWTMEDQVQLHRRGILPKAEFGSPQWREVEDGIRQGISAAETTRSERPRMCEDLPTVDAHRWERLAPILRRSPKIVDHGGMEDENRKRWAEALAVERLHGPDGPQWIAERIGALAAAGGLAGVERFREIARRYERLIGARQDGVTIRS